MTGQFTLAIPEVIGASRPVEDLKTRVQRAAARAQHVLVLGETGTGKELVARALHRLGGAADNSLHVLAAPELGEHLASSALFGHERGAFTGALQTRPGAFELAARGTLFLDEVGELTPANQSLLLRAIGEATFRRVGSARPQTFSGRLITATWRDLRSDVAAGRFREDLYHRIAGIVLRVPPLRERPEDIPLLIAHCVDRRRLQCTFATAAVARLQQHPWPGNVRELFRAIEQLDFEVEGRPIQAEDVDAHCEWREPHPRAANPTLTLTPPPERAELSAEAELERAFGDSCRPRAKGPDDSTSSKPERPRRRSKQHPATRAKPPASWESPAARWPTD